jgi:hypothetical protein
MDRIHGAIRQNICRKCMDGDRTGYCRLSEGAQCAIDAFLPTIVETIANVQSSSYEDYVNALRHNICAQCHHQMSNGICVKRDTLECALDRYYPLLVDVIESSLLPADASR